jgi:hypothetical protein
MLVLGKYFALRLKASFDAGLRMGLMSIVTEHAADFQNEGSLLGDAEKD